MPVLRRLREVRESKYLTQGELADATGISRQTISRLESHQIPARFGTIRALATALGVDPDELVGKTEQSS